MSQPSQRRRVVVPAFVPVVLVGLFAASPASADLVGATVGARVGGYGFRQPATETGGHTGWEDCRMNGLGLFAQANFLGLFGEAGIDTYFADAFPRSGHAHDASDGAADALAMDRSSTLVSAAVGVRMFPWLPVSPYLQLGAGVELTRVSLPEAGLEDSRVLPLGFIGVGGDLKVGRRLRLGANLRVHVMGHFEHDGSTLEPEPELAAQGQFYVSYTL
ncbi:MAG: hypothetical protein EXR73_05200 [Myxococcales bacterium]|nr:hypothetical protein [Myxococcales bacterium]